MTVPAHINLAAALDEVKYEGLIIEVAQRLRVEWLQDPPRSEMKVAWGAAIKLPTTTASGRKGKPKELICIINHDSPADLLRDLAELMEAGEVDVGGGGE